jgi:excinuclease UvrABC helicase subunit UvrB
MIMLGTAGTGKSFTVAAISKLTINTIIRACPTAKAAFLIQGNTF